MKLNEAKKRLEALLDKKKKERLSKEEMTEVRDLTEFIKKCGGKGEFKGKGHKDSEAKGKFGNDPAWWKKIPALMDNAANVPSNWIPGTPIDRVNLPVTIPGAFRFYYVPTYGRSFAATDPLNVWSRDLYLRMFQKWRGISAYSAADLGITLIASIEAVRMIAKLERIYGVINRYSRLNVNMPFTEEAALGLSPTEADWIRGHLSDYRYDLNVLIMKAQRLCIPNDLSLIQDQLSLLGYEYLDHDNVKGQIILIDSEVFGVYSDTMLTTGGSVTFTKFNTNTSIKTINTSGSSDNMFEALDTMLNALLGSDSVQRIYGDLITWFGDSQLCTFSALPEDYTIVPVYADTILHKLHNIDPMAGNYIGTILPTGFSTADYTALDTAMNSDALSYVICQMNDRIISSIAIASYTGTPLARFNVGTKHYYGGTPRVGYDFSQPSVLDSYRVEVTDDFIIEGTLFKNAGHDVTDGTNNAVELDAYGFELFYRVECFTINAYGTIITTGLNNQNTNANNIHDFAARFNFLDWAPICYYVDATTRKTVEIYGDVDTLIPMYSGNKSRILEAAVYSGLHTEVKVIA